MHPNDNVKQNNSLDIKQLSSNIKYIGWAFRVEGAKIKQYEKTPSETRSLTSSGTQT